MRSRSPTSEGRAMTDHGALLVAVDWRIERLEEAIKTATYGSNRRALAAERERLRRFARYVELDREFDANGGPAP